MQWLKLSYNKLISFKKCDVINFKLILNHLIKFSYKNNDFNVHHLFAHFKNTMTKMQFVE